MQEASSKVQVFFDSDIHMSYGIEWFILTTLHMTYVYRPVFQGESEFCGFRNARGHLESQVYLENNILKDHNNYNVHEFSIRFVVLEVQPGP